MVLDGTSILVTGGCGQIGIAIVRHLQEHYPTATIAVLDLEMPVAGSSRLIEKVIYYAGNITDKAIVTEVFETVKPVVVFHTAGLIPQIAKRLNMHNEKDYVAINVQGTRIVLDAATVVGSVKAFVFTSSADVVKGDSWQDLAGVNESIEIPEVFDNPYAKSKALAESFIISLSTAIFPTTAIRTHAVFSADDNNLVPLILSAPRNIHLGRGNNLYDFTYAPNLALAHVLAAENLLRITPAEASNPLSAAGKTFFVTNAEPVSFRTFTTMLWAAFDASGSNTQPQARGITIPVPVVLCLAWMSEKIARIVRKEPFLTVKDLGDGFAQRWFDNSAATTVLGYVPSTSLEQGLKETAKGYIIGTEALQ
ncbi:hypothetical protein V1525DRAFT_52429 [Lipomyces kononenkoae]|uniref:Uncharacterized protein n=1 Tax=Lipomyces kononenkoae TaxID=34357 RepID=A0ACC3SSG9_LIPKO